MALAACVLAAAGGFVVRPAGAQETSAPRPAPRYKAQPLNLRREQLGSVALSDVARKRMANGDCAGALDAFDAALRTSTDPTLRRDRGLCHERLGHPYPAIDDYRAYLTVSPGATDADSVRERLEKLEQQTLGYSSASTDVPGDVEGGASQQASASQRRGTAKASASVSLGSEGVAGRGSEHREDLDYAEREDDPLQTSLKRGKGWSVAPFFSEHKWGVSPGGIASSSYSGSPFGDAGTWSESVGIEARYSVGPSGALLLEAGYEHFNSTAIDSAVVSGLTSQIGFEWRFPLNPEYTNQLFLAPGLGFEHLVVQPGDAQSSSTSLGGFVPRVRFGWRHLLAPSAGIDVSIDGGSVNFFSYSHFPYDSNNPTGYLIGLNLALVWGL